MESKPMAGAAYWRLRFRRWGRRLPQQDGYTLLVPVPGDLPVFLDLALAVCRLQKSSSRISTLVLPDLATPAVEAAVAAARPSWPGPLELVRQPALERVVLPRLKDPGRNHGSQLIAGVTAARSSHVVLHDADLFMLPDDVHEGQYAHAVAEDFDALGISPSWDSWYGEHGLTLAATWEMTARVDWLRSFPPHEHLGHDAELFGEVHTFDTTFWAQCHTPQSRIGVRELGDDVVHFNYVISTYRRFQRHSGPQPFVDNEFRLLLIRLLIDLFDQGRGTYTLPALPELARGLTVADAQVRYPEDAAEVYRAFRGKVTSILQGPWTSPERRDRATDALAAFDGFYGWP
jgi:hypothetical protein